MITADGLTWSFGDRAVLHGVSLAARPGRVLGLVGPNGSGKTTLLRLLHGALSGSGTVRLDDLEPAVFSGGRPLGRNARRVRCFFSRRLSTRRSTL